MWLAAIALDLQDQAQPQPQPQPAKVAGAQGSPGGFGQQPGSNYSAWQGFVLSDEAIDALRYLYGEDWEERQKRLQARILRRFKPANDEQEQAKTKPPIIEILAAGTLTRDTLEESAARLKWGEEEFMSRMRGDGTVSEDTIRRITHEVIEREMRVVKWIVGIGIAFAVGWWLGRSSNKEVASAR